MTTTNPLAAEINAETKQTGAARDQAKLVKRYETWCAEHGFEAFPADEQMILRWLHTHYPSWSWGYAKNIPQYIRRENARRGHPPLKTKQISRYLQSLRRDLGSSKVAQTPAMTLTDLHEVVKALRIPRKPLSVTHTRVRGAVALAWLTGKPVHPQDSTTHINPGTETESIVSLHRDAFTRDSEGSLTGVTINGQHYEFDRARGGNLLQYVDEALTAHRRKPYPFKVQQFPLAMHTYLTRATRDDDPQWRDWDLEKIEWVLAAFDADLINRYRNVAILLTGVTLARRFQDLRELRLHHFTIHPDGVTCLQPRSKTDQAGRGVRKHIRHANPDRSCTHEKPCADLCPVAAIRDYFTFLRLVTEVKGTHPFTASLYARKRAAMTCQAWNYTLSRAWNRAGLPSERKVSSRSMRVTGATLAKHAGASIEQIQGITDHRDSRSIAIYVRKYDPTGSHITLSENP